MRSLLIRLCDFLYKWFNRDGWTSIDSTAMTVDGRWSIYTFLPLQGDVDASY